MTISLEPLLRTVKSALVTTSDTMGISFSDSSLKPISMVEFLHEDLALPIFVLAGLKLATDVELADQHFALDLSNDSRAVTDMVISLNPYIAKPRLAAFLTPLLVLEGFKRLLTEVPPTSTIAGRPIYSIHDLAEHLCPSEGSSDSEG